MNLVDVIQKEHSVAQRDKVVNYVGNNPGRFKKLIDVFLRGPHLITQRASWPLSYCVEKHPELARPHVKKLIRNLNQPHLHGAVKRNTVRSPATIHQNT